MIEIGTIASLHHPFILLAGTHTLETIRNVITGFSSVHGNKLDPKAKGIEAYSVVHHYEACGEATVVGRIDLLVALKKRFEDYPLIQSEDIVLKLA